MTSLINSTKLYEFSGINVTVYSDGFMSNILKYIIFTEYSLNINRHGNDNTDDKTKPAVLSSGTHDDAPADDDIVFVDRDKRLLECRELGQSCSGVPRCCDPNVCYWERGYSVIRVLYIHIPIANYSLNWRLNLAQEGML